VNVPSWFGVALRDDKGTEVSLEVSVANPKNMFKLFLRLFLAKRVDKKSS